MPPARFRAAARRSLRAQLLVNLGLLTSAAILIVGLTTALVLDAAAESDVALRALLALWGASSAVFFVFGGHLVRRLVVGPLRRLAADADRLATGDLAESGAYESTELAELAERYRTMAGELLDAQSQVVRVEKLAGVGLLAAGVAHEVRNPLGALSTYVEVLRRRDVAPEVTAEMRREIDRIERIIQGLLAYARPGTAGETTDARAAVQGALDALAAHGVLHGHTLLASYDDELPPVAGGRHTLEQAIVNLVQNACQASPAGRIWVGVQARSFEPAHRAQRRRTETTGGPPPEARRLEALRHAARPRRPDVPPGTRGVFVYVADEGPGVPEELRERIFDPFFTTRAPGVGTGLGLAIVARTIHEAGGMVWVDRAREGGAAFKIFLPAAEPAAAVPAAARARARRPEGVAAVITGVIDGVSCAS